MQLSALRTAVKIEVKRLGGNLPSRIKMDYYLNKAGDEFARESRSIRATYTVSVVAATSAYAMPAACLEILRVYHDGLPISHLTYDELDRMHGIDWRTWTGLPVHFFLNSPTTVNLYPIPTAAVTNGLVADYVAGHTTLTLDADVPTCSAKYHQALIWYACDQIHPADEFKGRYATLLQEARREVTSEFGRLTRTIPYSDF